MEGQRHEATDRAEGALRQQCLDLAGLVPQVAEGTELGGLQAELPHLRKDPLARQHDAPARDLADAPRDRRSGEPLFDAAGRCFHRSVLVTLVNVLFGRLFTM